MTTALRSALPVVRCRLAGFSHRSIIALIACVLVLGAGRSASAETISLNGAWNFVTDPSRSLTVTTLADAPGVRSLQVPGSWQAQLDDLRDYAGVAWYWRTVNARVPADRVALLQFAAVDYRADVFVNGQDAGTHEGGYLPFELDVTFLWRTGDNIVAVRVVDPGVNPSEVEGIRFGEIPHGKQDWYVQTSGLWRDVALDIRSRTRLGNVHVSADADGRFAIDVPLLGPDGGTTDAVRLTAVVTDTDGKTIWRGSRQSAAGEVQQKFEGRLTNPRLWSPESPVLYSLRVDAGSGESQTWQFGFRSFEARDGRFYLNGGPIYLRGALDQDFYPETVYTTPSLDYARDEMRKARSLGLNLLRHHIKAPDPRYLQAADEVGVLIWYDVPNWDTLTEGSRRRGLDTMRGMVDRDWNHPSIVALTIINEAWGMDITSATDRAWLKQAYQEAKAIVPGWAVVDNSPCCDNYHVVTDIADFHQYNVIPDHAAAFGGVIRDLASRPSWLFSPNGDAEARGTEPLMLSEFGNWGLPRLPAQQPWWFSRDFKGNPITRPDGIEERFRRYGYGSLFPSLDAAIDATQWHQYRALKYEIETLRAEGAIQGYVITEFTDINWEANGLLDMWRRPKIHAAQLSKLQQDNLLMARSDRRNYMSGDTVRATITLSRYGKERPGDRVAWSVDGTSLSGNFIMPNLAAGSVGEIGSIELRVPQVAEPGRHSLIVREESGGRVLRENTLELFFYPAAAAIDVPAAFHDPGGRLKALADTMTRRGSAVTPAGAATHVVVASVFDDAVREALGSGHTVILLPGTEAQTIAPGLDIVPRAGSSLDGNWITSFLWVRKDRAPFAGIGFDTLAGFEAQAVAPLSVIRGVPPEQSADVLSGIFYGWLHSNVATLVQASVGAGRLIVCTFSVAESYGQDPYATRFWDALLGYAASSFTPAYKIPIS